MKRIHKLLHHKSKSISQGAIILAIFTFGAQLLSLVRDRLFASQVGAGVALDTYYFAFKIPDILFAVFSALVSLTVLIPLLSKHKDTESDTMKHTYSILFTVFCIGSSVLILVVCALMPQLMHIVAPGVSDPEVLGNIVLYSRILLLQPFFLGLSNLLGSYTQLKERFLLYACSPFVYNLTTVLGLVFLYPRFGMTGVIASVVFGSILHGLIQLPFIHKENFLPSFKKITRHEIRLVREVISQSIPRAIILSLVQIEFLYLNSLTSHMSEGSTSLFNLANNIQGVPVTLIGVSLVIASFPTLSRTHANGEHVEFRKVFYKTLKTIAFWSLIASAGLFILKDLVIHILLGKSSFDVTSFNMIVATFGVFTLALIPQCVKMFITRGYYAVGDTKTPATLNILATALTIGIAFSLYIQTQSTSTFTVEVLAVAFVISSWVSGIVFYISARKNLLVAKISH